MSMYTQLIYVYTHMNDRGSAPEPKKRIIIQTNIT